MKPLKKIAGINLLVLFAYSAVIRILSSGSGQGVAMSILIMSAFAVGLHVLICLIVSAIEHGNKSLAFEFGYSIISGFLDLSGQCEFAITLKNDV